MAAHISAGQADPKFKTVCQRVWKNNSGTFIFHLLQIEVTFDMTNITQIWFEVHPREESMMNRLYSKSKLNLIYKGKDILLSYHPTITRNVNTRYHKCNEDNSNKITSCYDNFYMKKLNCSFPWLLEKNTNLNNGGNTGSSSEILKPFDTSKSQNMVPIIYFFDG